MVGNIIRYSLQNKLIILLFVAGIIGFGAFSLTKISIGAVPDITNNQVQVITTSRNLSTLDVEKFLTYPVELEMANLPGVKEIRSVSKFGLSVVTIVFEDEMGTYLPRQLIEEKLKNAEERIPAGFGKPFMGPISTGLGEIYQYILDVEPAYRGQYSVSDLRTIQDWIVKRQLSGIPGVVEINSWGGKLKQYEVAINPERLKALNISVESLYKALQENNSIAGGGYIEKGQESYFIRSEGLISSIQDMEEIAVSNRAGVPVLIRDVAEIREGFATRFGAITGNGEGEKILGQVMMLKGANSNAVIKEVKDRVARIQKNLPPGVYINGFLERSELIGRTTTTIAENLILGCLIVIFVVVLLLGNFRSGLVVASIIPLSLFFALSLMNIFGVDANLMSLGAIDFGIIIDGAVIIVEFVSFRMAQSYRLLASETGSRRQDILDRLTFEGTSNMMRSAVFGQIIIIIVFIPILTLSQIEGKMFRPMALVFCFALIGAMILCFTYIPVISSLILGRSTRKRSNLSEILIRSIQNIYFPVLQFALKQKSFFLGIAIVLLLLTGVIFSKMGGEFVPTLDEGDFVIQPTLKTGTSLSRTIELTTEMERILKQFPEVDQVVSRIGAAEVPTDPMSLEESDVIIKLNPRNKWTTSRTKAGLADAFKEALSVIPGVEYEFTQPIEMRFNELITGVRADLAIKLFGEDLQILQKKAVQIKEAIQNVDGAADISVDKVTGLPQMLVSYDRKKIAKYGLDIARLNRIISMGFGGQPVGKVFEGERQFDLVVRFEESFRKDLDNLRMAPIQLPNGQQLPLAEFARITYSEGPARVSRDQTKRRIVIGVNVRNRDLESVVNDVQEIIENEINLPTGYFIQYGGQFENLRNARERLMIAVPIALFLIFMMLYFAFGSVKDALIIFTAVPFSAVGGVLLLYLRGLPFSISAGVGFIALFGIAVLNGIVLIEYFKELKVDGIQDVHQRIIEGTKARIRPVLLTASAAALGFLPMAISTSAGAEVQRPLATVVIGGLISATILTLLILPIIYSLFEKDQKKVIQPEKVLAMGLFLFVFSTELYSQAPLSLEQAIELGLENNAQIQASSSRVQAQKLLKGTSFSLDPTSIYYQFDENNIAENGFPIAVWGVSQQFRMPGVYSAEKRLLESRTQQTEVQHNLEEWVLKKEISKEYFKIVYWQEVLQKYEYLDSLYSQFSYAAQRRFDLGESNQLEFLTAKSKIREVSSQKKQARIKMIESYQSLQGLIQISDSFHLESVPLHKLPFEYVLQVENHPAIQRYSSAIKTQEATTNTYRQERWPSIELNYFQGTNQQPNAVNYRGFETGIQIPFWQKPYQARIHSSQIQEKAIQFEKSHYIKLLNTKYEALLFELQSLKKMIDQFESEDNQLAEQLRIATIRSFEEGEINFFQYVQSMENAQEIELSYLQFLHQYNQTILDINYLTL